MIHSKNHSSITSLPNEKLDIFDSIVVSISACHPLDSSQEAGVRFPVGEIRFLFADLLALDQCGDPVR
jgi:hypothetical protein